MVPILSQPQPYLALLRGGPTQAPPGAPAGASHGHQRCEGSSGAAWKGAQDRTRGPALGSWVTKHQAVGVLNEWRLGVPMIHSIRDIWEDVGG